MNKVSVIIPVFNSEKYIARCLESIINQTYKNIEVIIVEDHSLDGSLEICEKYSNMDSRIKLYVNNKKGVSSARNLGISKATGEYITFVDSDDYIENKMYEEMVNYLESNNIDYIVCGYYIERKKNVNKVEMVDEKFLVENRDYFLTRVYLKNDILFNLTNTIIKRRKILDLRLEEEIYIGEDNLFMLQVLLNTDRGGITRKCYYHYFQNELSLSNIKEVNVKTISLLKSIEEQTRILQKIDDKKYYNYYRHVLLRDYVNLCRKMALTSYDDTKEVKLIRKKIRRELQKGAFFYKRTEWATIRNAIIVSISYKLFRFLYRHKNN